MSNTNTNLQTQTSNALHNAIMEVGSKDRPPMLASGNYVQWKSRIKRYIDTKTNNELIHYCLQNPPYKFKWTEKTVPVPEGSSETTTKGYMENYKNVSQDIRDQLDDEAEVVQIILTGIDNDIYSTVDACPNACEMWKAIERLKQEQADWRDDTDDEPEDQELEAHYLYMANIQEVTPDAANNSGPIFDTKPLQKVQNDNDNYNVFANDREHPEQPESVNDTYLEEQGDTNITIDSLDMSTNGETVDQDDDDLAKEHDFLASLIEKLKCETDDSKNRNKFLESSNKTLIDKLKGEIEDFKTKNKSLESSNNHFKEANKELAETNQLMFKDIKKFQAELDRYHDVNYASKMEIDCAKAKGDLMSHKMESQKSLNEHTRKINDLNQMISEMKNELVAHQETISIMSQEKEAQKKFHKTREDKELEKVIALENKIKILDDIVYKTGQSVQTMNMLNRNCKTSFVKPEFLKKAQRANPRLYDIGCYNDNLALMLAPESDETIRLAQESRSKLSDLIKPFDYKNLNNLYDLFVPQREKSPEQRYFSERSKMSHTPVKNENSKESFNKQTTLLEKRMDESIPWDQNTDGNLKILRNRFKKYTLSKGVYSREGLNHNLFFVGQFCDADLEVAFQKSTCYIRDLKGNDLLTGSRGTDLYSITLQDTSTPNPICLMAKASSSQAWLWHHRLSHLNFDSINLLSKNDIECIGF
ncbi:integrase, catalytic region, zinc finger, CCHC-type containing protein [Tanacetum coccineum]